MKPHEKEREIILTMRVTKKKKLTCSFFFVTRMVKQSLSLFLNVASLKTQKSGDMRSPYLYGLRSRCRFPHSKRVLAAERREMQCRLRRADRRHCISRRSAASTRLEWGKRHRDPVSGS